MPHIAILGATGHIGTALANCYVRRDDVVLDLYSRDPAATTARLADWETRARVRHVPVDRLDLAGCDIVLNAIGAGDPHRLREMGHEILALTLLWEQNVAHALKSNSKALYVFFSSGAVYGRLHDGPAQRDTTASFSVNEIAPDQSYRLAKFVAETQHRACPERRVVDIRIFGFVSQFLDLKGGYFLSELLSALRGGQLFRTAPDNMVRDYVGPEELAQLIDCCAARHEINMAVDIYSSRPAEKFALLKQLEAIGLRWTVDTSIPSHPERVTYASAYDLAQTLGYRPRRAAAEIVEAVACRLLNDYGESRSKMSHE